MTHQVPLMLGCTQSLGVLLSQSTSEFRKGCHQFPAGVDVHADTGHRSLCPGSGNEPRVTPKNPAKRSVLDKGGRACSLTPKLLSNHGCSTKGFCFQMKLGTWGLTRSTLNQTSIFPFWITPPPSWIKIRICVSVLTKTRRRHWWNSGG